MLVPLDVNDEVDCVKHLNPRQGITTRRSRPAPFGAVRLVSVKHLNPRQGITTRTCAVAVTHPRRGYSVKHLNPRQGITTRSENAQGLCWAYSCETPKSPPGDYNRERDRGRAPGG